MNGSRFRHGLGAALLAVAAVVGPVQAAEESDDSDDKGILTLQFENDVVANADGQFSHGTRVAWMTPEKDVPGWANQLADWIPRFSLARRTRIVYSLAQAIYTPDDITVPTLIPDDRPYAGWTYAGFGLVTVGDAFLDNLELDIGVVGPASLAETAQKHWHDWFDFREPRGWDNQLKNEPTIQLNFERRWRALETWSFDELGADVTPHVGIGLGNVVTQGAVGLTLRFGEDLPNDYGPPRIRPALPGSDYFVTYSDFGWYFFVGAEGRAVAHNIFLDGNTFRESHSVDKKYFVADFQAGIAMFIHNVRIAYTHVLRTKEFDTQDKPQQFGAFSVSVRF